METDNLPSKHAFYINPFIILSRCNADEWDERDLWLMQNEEMEEGGLRI